MGLCVTFVSGVDRSGKSTLVRLVAQQVGKAHYLRLTHRDDGACPPLKLCDPADKEQYQTSTWIAYDRERVFEILPDALAEIRRQDRHGRVLIEADSDTHLRHAYPYDHRVFVMAAPHELHEVFRTPNQAASAFKEVLNDTAMFASEIFGLFAGDSIADVDAREERPELTASQMRAFLDTPLGDELASRIQLQPAYHGLTESDVVVINAPGAANGPAVQGCVERIEYLLRRIRKGGPLRTHLFACDLLSDTDPNRQRLVESLDRLVRTER